MRLALVLESNTDRRILEGLAARCELTVFARQPKLTEFPPAPGVSFATSIGPGGRARYAAYLLSQLGRQRFDGIVAQGYFVAALAANLAARGTRTPVVMFVCNPMERYYRCRQSGEWPDRPFRASELAALERVARVNARVGRRYAVLSEHLADVVRSHGTRRPVEIVPAYGVDPEVFRPADAPRKQLREELGLPVGEEIAFFSSRVSPEKDAGTLLDALGRLHERGRRPWLLSCARGQQPLIAAARERGLADRLLARDMVDPGPELARRLQACDVVVQASREEGLGFAPLEALACGVPVIAAAVGGLRETIRDGETGWSYPVGDAPALAAALEAVLDDPEEARRRTTAGAAMVRERFRPGAAFDRLVELAATR